MLSKFMETLDRGITTVSVKSEIMVEANRIKTEMNSLRREITSAKTMLGETVYQGWHQGGTEQKTIDDACAAIQEQEQRLNQLQLHLEQLKGEEENRLKAQAACIYCPQCGSANPVGANFCGSCGEKMP